MTVDDTVRTDRRDALKKIAVGGAVVWAAPALAKPAFAGGLPSGCVENVLDWSTLGGTFTSTTVGGVTVSLSTSFDGGSAARGTNRTIIAGPQGGLSGSFLRFEQDAVTNGGQTITLNFSQPVENVSFVITDIDNLENGWSDRITVNTAGFTPSFPGTSTVIGVGTTGNGTGGTTTDGNGGSNTGTGAFRNSINSENILNNDGRGNLGLAFAGPISSFSIRFWCGGFAASPVTNQLINVGNITFTACD